jgi:tetratricopeptide (TPR) repeat protein
MKKPTSKAWFLLLIPLFIFLAYLIYQFPPVNDRLSWRIEELKTRLSYFINPPDEAVFIPDGDTPISSPSGLLSTETPEPTLESSSQQPTPEGPEIITTPLPESVILDGVIYVDQHERWNYCGPANLSMALNFWGWPGDRDDIARVIKPGINNPDLNFIQQGRHDKNVMPSEMIDFVAENTEFNIVARYGGDLDLIKSFIASGFPVLVEKGYYEEDYTGKVAWLGHYLFTTGYDDAAGEFVVQDAYLEPGRNRKVDYETYLEGWRSFNYLLMVVYPPDRQEEILQILGTWQDPFWAYQHALEIAEEEILILSGVDEFFAWFNFGTSLVKMEHYLDAGEAFDQAYRIYYQLVDDDTTRPYRITWYQTAPYRAYYFSGRYQDVINLANFTFETIDDDTLEESLYWRGMAHFALGHKALAKLDLYNSVWLNPNFEAGLIQINNLIFDD